jgi:hypothetical protein
MWPLTSLVGFASIRVTTGRPEHAAVLNFLNDRANNNSYPAEQEWRAMEAQFPQEMDRVFDHIQLVEACQSMNSNPLRQATSVTGAADLFWWGVVGVGAFYLYDGADLTVVLVDRVRNPHPSWADLAQAALARI